MYLNKINQYINIVHLGGAPAIASASGAFVAGNDAKSVAAHKPPADEISKGRSDSTEALADSYWKVQRMMEEAALEKPSPAPTCKDTGSEKSEDAKSALTSGSGHEGKELGGDQGEDRDDGDGLSGYSPSRAASTAPSSRRRSTRLSKFDKYYHKSLDSNYQHMLQSVSTYRLASKCLFGVWKA